MFTLQKLYDFCWWWKPKRIKVVDFAVFRDGAGPVCAIAARSVQVEHIETIIYRLCWKFVSKKDANKWQPESSSILFNFFIC